MTQSGTVLNENFTSPSIDALPEITFILKRTHISGMGRTRSQKPKCAFQKGVPILMILVQHLILLRFVHNRAQPGVAMCLRVG